MKIINFDLKSWEVEVPEQKVSGGGVSYERNDEEIQKFEEMGFVLVGSVHSHCEMGAFHSSTDDADEFNFDGLHITIGKINSGPEFACRFVMKDDSYKIERDDCLDWIDVKPKTSDGWLKKVQKEVFNKKKKDEDEIILSDVDTIQSIDDWWDKKELQ